MKSVGANPVFAPCLKGGHQPPILVKATYNRYKVSIGLSVQLILEAIWFLHSSAFIRPLAT